MRDQQYYQQARLSRDRRFDGLFFIAVKTTGIYCRPICPAQPPKERNVTYFPMAIAAANAGYRPCLRCRPDSAPGSPAWNGANTTLQRALKLINNGALQDGDLQTLATRLGVTDRYVRRLFDKELGISPKAYALYQQGLFAKKLLHETSLPITDIALATGFNSLRRFNDCFKKLFQLTPRDVRKNRRAANGGIHLFLSFRPPYNWPLLHDFLAARLIDGLEWIDDDSYGRSFRIGSGGGWFTARFDSERSGFHVQIDIDDLHYMPQATQTIRRLLDLDADIAVIETAISGTLGVKRLAHSGLRLPGIWDVFEAGVRAILGQQVSVAAARKLVRQIVDEFNPGAGSVRYFPRPADITNSELAFLKIPGSRKSTLTAFAEFVLQHELTDDPDALIHLKGIGPWTIDYLKMRGLSDPDIFLDKDLGVKKALEQFPRAIEAQTAAPWRSYLTFHLWSMH